MPHPAVDVEARGRVGQPHRVVDLDEPPGAELGLRAAEHREQVRVEEDVLDLAALLLQLPLVRQMFGVTVSPGPGAVPSRLHVYLSERFQNCVSQRLFGSTIRWPR